MDNPNLDLNRSAPSLDPSQEQLIRQLVQSLLAQRGERSDSESAKQCRCHWLDCSKTPVLLWKNGNTFTLKIATQKLIGFARKDKHGTEYWRFRNDDELVSVKQEVDKKVQVSNPPLVEPKPEPKVKEEVNNEVEKVQLELGVSESVQKFQEKYGTADSPKGER